MDLRRGVRARPANNAAGGRRSETLYTADLHLGHRLVTELRGFDSTDDHDNELARRWDTTVGEGDVVWVLGDISGGVKSAWR